MSNEEVAEKQQPRKPEEQTTDTASPESQQTEAQAPIEEPEGTVVPQELPESEQPASEAAPEVVIAAMAQELEQAQAKASENWDRLLRLQAEMENLRKRSQRDIEHAHKYSLESIANELLAVRDSLELGLEAANSEEAEVEKIREGTELTLKMLVQAMEKFNIEQVDPLNEKFDPQWHQAMTVQEAEGKAPNTVLMVIQKGYKLNDRLLRPALVTVSK